MISFFFRDNWGRNHEMEITTWYSVTSQALLNLMEEVRAYKLRNKSVKVGVCKFLIIEISSADIVDGFIIKHKRNIIIL